MAGIGFQLKKLFRRKEIFSRIAAFGYTGAVTTGPMLMGILFLLLISFLGQRYGLSEADQNLLVSLITYAMLGSTMLTSILSMVLTRYTSDMIYEEKEEFVLPALTGALVLTLPAGAVLSIVFLFFSHLSFTISFFHVVLFLELTAVWFMTNDLTAIKDYRGILIVYGLSMSVSVLAGWISCTAFSASIELLSFAVTIGYGLIMLGSAYLLSRHFTHNACREYFTFLKWIGRYPALPLIGFMTNAGLFSHLVIAWKGSGSIVLQGLFLSNPRHDAAAMFAFLTILVTNVTFTASLEVSFYPKYRAYYDLFNGTGSITEIDAAEKEMLDVLERELANTARIQFFTTALAISLGTEILNRLPLGFDALMNEYFRILSTGYGSYAVGNVIMLIMMYFNDYKGAGRASVVFAASTTIFSLFLLAFPADWYCFGFTAGALVYFLYCWRRLGSYTADLPYTILSKQPLTAETEDNFFAAAADWLNQKAERS